MCRNIKTLFNFEPPATHDEIKASDLQYVRKISGINRPSRENDLVFEKTVDEITKITQQMLVELTTSSRPKNREVEAEKARLKNKKRFGVISQDIEK